MKTMIQKENILKFYELVKDDLPYFTLNYVITCLCIIDIDLGFVIPVIYIHID